MQFSQQKYNSYPPGTTTITFTERTHAYLSASFYRHLKAENYHNYRAVFRMATQLYAQQRGSRMAQRALRDGHELDFATYRAYGEWTYTEEGIKGLGTDAKVSFEGQDLKIDAYNCPWAAQYKAMGLEDGGCDYCDDLDPSIARGFNPDLKYEVTQTQYHGVDSCIHILHDSKPEKQLQRDPANLRPFEYHCAHVYHTFARLMAAVYGPQGEQLSQQVLADLAAEYGQDHADKLLEYSSVDFNYID